jgi:hypothetical protein
MKKLIILILFSLIQIITYSQADSVLIDRYNNLRILTLTADTSELQNLKFIPSDDDNEDTTQLFEEKIKLKYGCNVDLYGTISDSSGRDAWVNLTPINYQYSNGAIIPLSVAEKLYNEGKLNKELNEFVLVLELIEEYAKKKD